MHDKLKAMDSKELDFAETSYVRDIENRVFQGIALQCLAKIEGISLLGGGLFDSLLGREVDPVKGIHVEQDQKKHAVEVRLEINIEYGVSIPEKADEIQKKIVEEINSLTGLHVKKVHVIFKSMSLKKVEQGSEEALI